MTGWNQDTLARTAGENAVTIVEGSSFCVSSADGDIDSTRPHGVFVHDTRIVSAWSTLVNGMPLQVLSAMVHEPYHATFLARAAHGAGKPDGSLVVRRERWVGVGLREELTVSNFSPRHVDVVVEVGIEVDFADIFDVKESRVRESHPYQCAPGTDRLIFEGGPEHDNRGVVFRSTGATIEGDRLIHRLTLAPHEAWSTTYRATPSTGGVEAVPHTPEGQPPHEREIQKRFMAWHEDVPVPILENFAIELAIRRGQSDLGSLRIFDTRHPERLVVAAGAPWFMALFGRDSLLTSIMALPVDPSLALGTLRTLGDLQGTTVNPLTEEEPGKILHEVRLGVQANIALGGRDTYFGTVDATPLYVVAVGELTRWGVVGEDLADLVEHSDRALEWILNYGDRDGDGFIEYERATPAGLENQGWKDSWDSIMFADGTFAQTPIALCEAQGYVYAAFRARAHLARESGHEDLHTQWTARAVRLKDEFNKLFWLDDRKYFAIALDRDKRPVDACASNMGHCLWSGIVDDDKAPYVAERLMSPEMFSGWGIRTLSTDMASYNPASYHNGSVWPHDNAIIAAGLMRYGFIDQAQRVALALFEAAEHFDGRLPELFCGFSRRSYDQPVPYPNACSPQAWASATPLSLVRTLLRLDVSMPTSEVWLAPAFPKEFGHIRIENMKVGSGRVAISVDGDDARISGLPSGVTLHRSPRHGGSGG